MRGQEAVRRRLAGRQRARPAGAAAFQRTVLVEVRSQLGRRQNRLLLRRHVDERQRIVEEQHPQIARRCGHRAAGGCGAGNRRNRRNWRIRRRGRNGFRRRGIAHRHKIVAKHLVEPYGRRAAKRACGDGELEGRGPAVAEFQFGPLLGNCRRRVRSRGRHGIRRGRWRRRGERGEGDGGGEVCTFRTAPATATQSTVLRPVEIQSCLVVMIDPWGKKGEKRGTGRKIRNPEQFKFQIRNPKQIQISKPKSNRTIRNHNGRSKPMLETSVSNISY